MRYGHRPHDLCCCCVYRRTALALARGFGNILATDSGSKVTEPDAGRSSCGVIFGGTESAMGAVEERRFAWVVPTQRKAAYTFATFLEVYCGRRLAAPCSSCVRHSCIGFANASMYWALVNLLGIHLCIYVYRYKYVSGGTLLRASSNHIRLTRPLPCANA